MIQKYYNIYKERKNKERTTGTDTQTNKQGTLQELQELINKKQKLLHRLQHEQELLHELKNKYEQPLYNEQELQELLLYKLRKKEHNEINR